MTRLLLLALLAARSIHAVAHERVMVPYGYLGGRWMGPEEAKKVKFDGTLVLIDDDQDKGRVTRDMGQGVYLTVSKEHPRDWPHKKGDEFISVSIKPSVVDDHLDFGRVPRVGKRGVSPRGPLDTVHVSYARRDDGEFKLCLPRRLLTAERGVLKDALNYKIYKEEDVERQDLQLAEWVFAKTENQDFNLLDWSFAESRDLRDWASAMLRKQ